MLAVASLVRSGLFGVDSTLACWSFERGPWPFECGGLQLNIGYLDQYRLEQYRQNAGSSEGLRTGDVKAPGPVGTVRLFYKIGGGRAGESEQIQVPGERRTATVFYCRALDIKDEIGITATVSVLKRGRRSGARNRYYFCCPGLEDAPCGKRVGKLYLPPGELYFRCRQCHNLTYRSSKEHDKRVDALLRSPIELIQGLNSKDSRKVYPALKACLRMYGII